MLEEYSNVLVTGGAGFIGSHVVDSLLSLSKKVVVFDNLLSGLEENVPSGATLVRGDVRNPRQIAEAAKGADLIFHLAANANGTVSVNDPRLDFETNALGTFNVLDAALQAGVRKFVHLSSASVYGTPQRFPMGEDHPTKPFVPYGASKLAAEICCRSFFDTYGLPVVIGRPFCVYGPRENPQLALVEVARYVRWHLNGKPIQIVGDPDRKTRDFVHVSDVVQGLLLTADRAPVGEVLNLGSGEEVTMRELADVIGSVTGRPAVIDAIPEITDDTYRLVGDVSKIRSLGYAPRVSLAEGVKDLAEKLGERPEMPTGPTIFKRGQRAEDLGRVHTRIHPTS